MDGEHVSGARPPGPARAVSGQVSPGGSPSGCKTKRGRQAPSFRLQEEVSSLSIFLKLKKKLKSQAFICSVWESTSGHRQLHHRTGPSLPARSAGSKPFRRGRVPPQPPRDRTSPEVAALGAGTPPPAGRALIGRGPAGLDYGSEQTNRRYTGNFKTGFLSTCPGSPQQPPEPGRGTLEDLQPARVQPARHAPRAPSPRDGGDAGTGAASRHPPRLLRGQRDAASRHQALRHSCCVFRSSPGGVYTADAHRYSSPGRSRCVQCPLFIDVRCLQQGASRGWGGGGVLRGESLGGGLRAFSSPRCRQNRKTCRKTRTATWRGGARDTLSCANSFRKPHLRTGER